MKTFKNVILIEFTLFFLIELPLTIHYFADSLHGSMGFSNFYLTQNYFNADHLFTVLFNVTSLHEFFLWCCDCMLYYARLFNLSYEEINIYVFVIWQPFLILLFAYLSVNYYIKYRKLKKQKLS